MLLGRWPFVPKTLSTARTCPLFRMTPLPTIPTFASVLSGWTEGPTPVHDLFWVCSCLVTSSFLLLLVRHLLLVAMHLLLVAPCFLLSSKQWFKWLKEQCWIDRSKITALATAHSYAFIHKGHRYERSVRTLRSGRSWHRY